MPFVLDEELPGYCAVWSGPIVLAEIQGLRSAIEDSAPEGGYGYALIDLRAAEPKDADLERLHTVTREIRDSTPRPGFRVAFIGAASNVDAWVRQLSVLVEFGSDRWRGGPPEMERFDGLAEARTWAQAWDRADDSSE